MTRDYPSPRHCTGGERCRGIAEMVIIVGLFVCILLFPGVMLLPVVAAAGLLLVVLAVWDDAAARRAERLEEDKGQGRSGQ
jgi:hypothetical protein